MWRDLLTAIPAPSCRALRRGGLLAAVLSAFALLSGAGPARAFQTVWSAVGEEEGSRFGYSASLAGDFDGDGLTDLLVGAMEYSGDGNRRGRAYIYFGADLDAPPLILTAGDLDADNARFGLSVCALGDFDGDGYDDVAVGQPLADVDGVWREGRVFVFRGGLTPDGDADLILAGQREGGLFGLAVAGVGDFDGDGRPDLVVGEPMGTNSGLPGRAYLFRGGETPSATPALVFEGDWPSDRFGIDVADLGDFDGDGAPDLIIGATHRHFSDTGCDGDNCEAGRACIYLGGVASDAVADVEVDGEINTDGRLGEGVVSAGDFNHDGYADALIGAYHRGLASEGRAYVLYGGPDVSGTRSPDLYLSDDPVGPEPKFGIDVCGLGDVNGDGYTDLAVAAPKDFEFGANAGKVVIFFGGLAPDDRPDSEICGWGDELMFGDAIIAGGDFGDLAVGMPGYDNGRGRLSVIDLQLQPQTPEAPDGIALDWRTATRVRIVWNDNSTFENGFTVRRAADAAGPYTEVGTTLPDSNAFLDRGLVPDATYYYTVSSFVDDGHSATSGPFAVTTAANDPPSGVLSELTAEAGLPLTVTAELTDDVGVESAELHWRRGGDPVFTTAPMARETGDVWAAVIPGDATTLAGLQYYVRVFDEATSVCLPAGAPDSVFADADVQITNDEMFRLTGMRYALLGMPIVAQDDDPAWIFDELGHYADDVWRLFTWSGAASYREYGQGAAALEPGRGFWIVSATDAAIRASGSTTPLTVPLAVTLHPGWNLVANPYAFPIAAADALLPAEAAHDFVGYVGTGYRHFVETLQPGAGYWLYLSGTVDAELRFPPVGAPDTATKRDDATAAPPADDCLWSVRIDAAFGDRRCDGHRFGMRADAGDGIDACDFRDAPAAPGPAATISLVHDDSRLLTDYRGVGTDGALWRLEMSSDLVGSGYDLSFSVERPLPEGWQLLAIDAATLDETDLTGGGSLTGPAATAGVRRSWWLAAGTPAFVGATRQDAVEGLTGAGTTVFMGPAWPNPARGPAGASVRLVLARPADVSLRVFDMRGRVVDVLHRGRLDAGASTFTWSGNDAEGRRMPSGVYFLRMASDDDVRIEKLVLVR